MFHPCSENALVHSITYMKENNVASSEGLTQHFLFMRCVLYRCANRASCKMVLYLSEAFLHDMVLGCDPHEINSAEMWLHPSKRILGTTNTDSTENTFPLLFLMSHSLTGSLVSFG